VKSSKKPSKEPPLPSQDEYRRFNVLQEELISKFRTFGESLSSVRDDVSSMKPKLDKLDKLGEDVEILKSAARSHTDTIRANTEDIRSLKDAVRSNTEATRANTEAIHAVQTDLKNINQRLEVVEAKVAS
jgi:chromosome segregation ATPase